LNKFSILEMQSVLEKPTSTKPKSQIIRQYSQPESGIDCYYAHAYLTSSLRQLKESNDDIAEITLRLAGGVRPFRQVRGHNRQFQLASRCVT
jgi:hypothetical protein